MRERELRLALVCNGGISLAVYMHGITKEIWQLLRASRAHSGGEAPAGGTADHYRRLLARIEAHSGTRLRVLCDILTGASAGGINAIFLARAIVEGRSLDPLTKLWLEKADVEELLDEDARPGRFGKLWAVPIAWQALRQRGVVERMVSPEAQAEVEAKLSHFVRARWFAPPFGGAQFCHTVFDAAEAMGPDGDGAPLLPREHPLDLGVTCTDFWGHRQRLRLHSPTEVSETEHRLTIDFSTRRSGPGVLAELPELVFAARATASFPGAFPPFMVGELDGVLAERGIDWGGRDAFLARVLPVHHRAGMAEEAVLIDGSVLANSPFAQAMEALRNRPSRREVDRRFLYIDPIPDVPVFRLGGRAGPDGPAGSGLPGFFTTIFGASSNIPREQPIRDNLREIERRSQRIRHMREVTRNLRPEIEATVEAMLGNTWFLSRPTPARLTGWRQGAQEKAARAAGFAYASYGHLKLAGIVDEYVELARRAHRGTSEAGLSALREALWTELRARGLDHIGASQWGASPAAIEFFRKHDLRFRIRRIRFLLRRLAEDIEAKGEAPAEAVAAMEEALYEALSQHVTRAGLDRQGEAFAEVAANAAERPAAFLDAIAGARDLIALDSDVDARLCTALVALPPAERRALLLAYVGFPLVDIATLPLLQEEAVDEFDPIKVDRISPEDATTIRHGTLATLKGIEFNSFGAFFSRAYRENDYLWGRLHGADRMVDITLSALPGQPLGDAEVRSLKKALFAAILDEESPRLTAIAELIATLRKEVAAIDG